MCVAGEMLKALNVEGSKILFLIDLVESSAVMSLIAFCFLCYAYFK